MSVLLVSVVVPLAITCIGVLLAIALGGPATPPAMPSINNPFKAIDYSNLPASERYVARDGERLAFRRYARAPEFSGAQRGSVVLVHGSSASSNSMHTLAQAFAAAGLDVYALDIRGHGESGAKGCIAYVGQLECDLEDFMTSVRPRQPVTLVGFSSGGGWVRVGVPRLLGADDEAFVADRYAEVFAREAKDVPVTVVPGVGHIPLTLTPAGTRVAVAAVLALNA